MTVEEIAARLVAQAKRVSVAEADTCGLVGYMPVPCRAVRNFFRVVSLPIRGLKQSILGVSDELYKTRASVLKWRLPWRGAYAI